MGIGRAIGFAKDYYGWLAREPRTVIQAESFIVNNGSANTRKNLSHFLGIWKLVDNVRKNCYEPPVDTTSEIDVRAVDLISKYVHAQLEIFDLMDLRPDILEKQIEAVEKEAQEMLALLGSHFKLELVSTTPDIETVYDRLNLRLDFC